MRPWGLIWVLRNLEKPTYRPAFPTYPVQPVRELGTIGAYRDELVQSLFGTMLNQRLAELAQLPDAPYLGASSSLGKLTPQPA